MLDNQEIPTPSADVGDKLRELRDNSVTGLMMKPGAGQGNRFSHLGSGGSLDILSLILIGGATASHSVRNPNLPKNRIATTILICSLPRGLEMKLSETWRTDHDAAEALLKFFWDLLGGKITKGRDYKEIMGDEKSGLASLYQKAWKEDFGKKAPHYLADLASMWNGKEGKSPRQGKGAILRAQLGLPSP